jgi:hypothetical protein
MQNIQYVRCSDTQVEGCNSCPFQCINDKGTLVYPCFGGRGSVDTTRCIVEGYQSVQSLTCPDSYYVSPTSQLSAIVRPLDQVAVNSIYNLFALMDPFAGTVRMWESESLDRVLSVAAISSHLPPVMQFTAPRPGAGVSRILASFVWSMDGNILYVVHMDGAITRMQARFDCVSFLHCEMEFPCT